MFEFIEDADLRAKAVSEYENSIKVVNDGVQKKVDEAVLGLKAKNEELLGEKKKLQELANSWKDIDPDKARQALELLEKSEYAQMLKDGKFEEALEKRISTATGGLKAQLEQLQQQYEVAKTESTEYKSKFQRKIIDDSIREAALELGVQTKAIEDVIMRGSLVFSLGEDGQVEARDKQGNLMKNKDKLILTPKVWVEGLKESHPYYWPPSEGAGFGGGRGSETDLNKQLALLADKGDIKGYREARDKARKSRAM